MQATHKITGICISFTGDYSIPQNLKQLKDVLYNNPERVHDIVTVKSPEEALEYDSIEHWFVLFVSDLDEGLNKLKSMLPSGWDIHACRYGLHNNRVRLSLTQIRDDSTFRLSLKDGVKRMEEQVKAKLSPSPITVRAEWNRANDLKSIGAYFKAPHLHLNIFPYKDFILKLVQYTSRWKIIYDPKRAKSLLKRRKNNTYEKRKARCYKMKVPKHTINRLCHCLKEFIRQNYGANPLPSSVTAGYYCKTSSLRSLYVVLLFSHKLLGKTRMKKNKRVKAIIREAMKYNMKNETNTEDRMGCLYPGTRSDPYTYGKKTLIDMFNNWLRYMS